MCVHLFAHMYECVCLSVSVALSWPNTKAISDCYFGCMYSMSTIIYCAWVYNYVFVLLLSRQSQHDELKYQFYFCFCYITSPFIFSVNLY